MEIDLHSPSFRAARTKTKRPRSPTSPGPLDRPSKRLSFGLGDANTVCTPVAQAPPLSCTSTHAPVPEDWVVQTRGLRIASPHIAQGQGPGLPRIEEADVERGGSGMDTVMQTDGDVPMSTASPPRPYFSASAAPSFHCAPEPQFHATIQIPAVQPRDVTALLSPPVLQSALAADAVCDASNASSSTGQGQPQARRLRMTMGPRADCEKCRMGVKGHWMHFE